MISPFEIKWLSGLSIKHSAYVAIYLLGGLLLNKNLAAQGGTWIWMNGSDTTGGRGFYGALGVPSPNNSPPPLYQAEQWTDKQGNFWIYGGEGTDSTGHIIILSDLWKFDPIANLWTWVKGTGAAYEAAVYGTKGIPSLNNTPGARIFGFPAWTDSAGDLWLFSGYGYGGSNIGLLNDLWRYNIASNEWTWMGGPAAVNQPGVFGNLYQSSASFLPPPRNEDNTSWTDANGNLWLFGGDTLTGFRNDLWRYNVSTGQWAWMSGSQGLNDNGSYGTLGLENPSNRPPARNSYTHWISGNDLYMTCGNNDSGYVFNDVWRFNLNTNNWTWVGGDSGNVPLGVYNQYCSETGGNMPRGRFEERSTQSTGCSPQFFLWGGHGAGATTNDLWNFDPASGNWKWISGASGYGGTAFYGTKGISNSLNVPGPNMGSCFWGDFYGNLWLWGGSGEVNTMWEFVPDPSCLPADTGSGNLSFQLSSVSVCFGDSVIISFTGDSGIVITPGNPVTWIDSLHAVIKPDTTTTFTASGYSSCGYYNSQPFTLTVLTESVSITANKTQICPGDTAKICAPTGFTSYYWNTSDTTACINTPFAGSYYLTVTGNGHCSAVSNQVVIGIYQPSPVTISVSGDTLNGFGATSYQWLLNGTPISGATSSVYIANTSGSYTLQVTDSNGCIANSSPVVISGVQEEILETSIKVFPNPSSGSWQMLVPCELIGSKATIYDATGRAIYQVIIHDMQSAIIIPGIAKGIYDLSIAGGIYSFPKKLVVM